MTSCPRCGAATMNDQNFCSNCGFDLRVGEGRSPAAPDTYTPSHLAQRILEDRHALVGERKQVTVMFADIVDSTAAIEGADPEEAARFLTTALDGMMTEIHRFEGTVNELRGDGLMALFGAPLAHEDHAVRAAQAALAIPAAVADATNNGALTRVGLHSGEVLVRGVGNDLSIEYQALGPTVHLAARMESLAEAGTTYVTEETRRLIDGRIDIRHVGAMDIKGISDVLDVYELSDVTEATSWEARATRGLTEFTGRSSEFATVHRAMEVAASGQGRVVNIKGDAGVGKSRLVHELLSDLEEPSQTILRAYASPYESKTAYHPIRKVLEGLLSDAPGHNPTIDELSRVLSEISPDLGTVAPVFGALLEIGDTSEWNALPAPRRRRDTRDAVKLAISTLSAEGPLIVVLEDLHWIDSETEGVIEELVTLARTSPFGLVLTFRPEFEASWAHEEHVKELHLRPLETESSMRFLECLVGEDESLAAIKGLMNSRAEGVPLFMEEVVRSLADSGILIGEPGSYTATSNPEEMEIPGSVHSVVAARIDRLTDDDKTVLQVAAVVGDTVPLLQASQLLHRTQESTLQSFGRLIERNFLLRHPASSTEFGFTHALIRDVAYGSLPVSERRAMHAEMVAVIDKEPEARSVERLAFHASKGEMWREAVTYSLEAADRSISKSAFVEASAFLRDATEALSHLPETDEVINLAIDTRMKLRVAETGARGGLKRLVSDLDEAAALADSHEDWSRRALVAIHAGYAANMLGDAYQADRHAEVALETAKRTNDRIVIMESQLLLAQSLLYSGRYSSVVPTLDPLMEFLTGEFRHETADQTMIRSVVACCHYAVASAGAGDVSNGEAWSDTAYSIAEETGRPFDLMYSLFAKGKCLSFMRKPGAVSAHEESERIAEEGGLSFIKTFTQPWHGHALIRAGRVADGVALLRKTISEAKRVDLPFTEAEARAFTAVGSRLLGNDPTIDAEFALAFGKEHGTPILEIVGGAALGDMATASAMARENGLDVWASELEAGAWFDPI